MPSLERPDARIHYLREGQGPAVLLLHGVGVPGQAWRPQLDAFADRYSLIAVDNRGSGGSEVPGGKLSVETMAEDALAVLDAERVDRFHVVGHSMGGSIAQEVALRAPQRVMSLALLCAFLRGAQAARLSPSLLFTGLRTKLGTRAMRRAAFLEIALPRSYLRSVDRARVEARLAALFGHDLADSPKNQMRQFQALVRHDVSPRLVGLAPIPTLVMSASDDRIADPAFGRALASAIPGARFVELADAGHAATIHAAEAVNALLLEHLAAAARP